MLLAFSIVTIPSYSAVYIKEGGKQSPITVVLNHDDFQSYLFSVERYMPPEKLTNRNPSFRALSEEEKEKVHLKWFKTETEKRLQKVIKKEFVRRLLILTVVIPCFLLFFGASYLAITRLILQSLMSLVKGGSASGSSETSTLIMRLLKYIELPFNAFFNVENIRNIPENDQQPPQANGGGNRVNNMLIIMAFHYAFIYFKYPLQWLWGQVKAIWKLFWFSRHLDYEDPLARADHLFIKTYNILRPEERKRLVTLLLRARAGGIRNISQLVKLIRVYRALPRGIKEAVFNRKRFDQAFANYPPDIQAFARQISAMLVIYTKALKAGKGNIFARLPIQPFLFLGSGGIGKSRLLAKISEATGLRPVSLNLTDRQLTTLRGMKRGEPGSGVLSIYADALIDSADARGRNYANSPLLIEEIDKALHDPSAIHYFLDLLDPRTRYIKDNYLGVKVPKLIFIFATSNYKIPEGAIVDRFRTIRMNGITKENKKKILRNTLVPAWIQTLNNPSLQGAYDDSLDVETATQEVMQELQAYIEENDEGSVRALEQKMFEKIASIMAKSLEKKTDKKKPTTPREA